jgi:hypothetical protein
VTKHIGSVDVLASRVELDHGISAGLWLSSLSGGLVPVFEEHSARLERGINLDTWERMSIDEKAFVVAIRRIANAVHNLQTEAEIQANQKNIKKN